LSNKELSLQTDESWLHVLRVLPPDVQARVQALPLDIRLRIEEVRFRVGQPVQICGLGLDGFLHKESGWTDDVDGACLVTEDHISRILQAATQASLYAVEDELRRGFVTMPGGHRVGVAGRAVLTDSGTVRTIRSIHAVNIRIAREHIGVSQPVHPYVVHQESGKPLNVLLISPPQCGKTTILRDMVRAYSEGQVAGVRHGLKVTVVDERSEIAGSVAGVPQFHLGPRTDVLDACPKAEGMLMAIRSLSPDVVATDEIGRDEDSTAILDATHAGVSVLATAHAHTVDEWRKRPAMASLFAAHAFDRYVVLSRRRGPGTVEQVLDARGMPLGRIRVQADGRVPDA
jgi:stage III sporulation protein AA